MRRGRSLHHPDPHIVGLGTGDPAVPPPLHDDGHPVRERGLRRRRHQVAVPNEDPLRVEELPARQLMPAGAEVTWPGPVMVTVICGWPVKLALTWVSTRMFTVQVVVTIPLHAPPQETNCFPASGVAVNVTEVFGWKLVVVHP